MEPSERSRTTDRVAWRDVLIIGGSFVAIALLLTFS